MKRLGLSLLLMLTLLLPAVAVENDQVMYAGGTVREVKAGAIGRLDTTLETALIFEHPGGKLLVRYSDIESFAYDKEVTRHLGVLPAIAIGMLKMRQHSHFFRISYRDDKGDQVAVFEVSKQMPRVLQAVLASRSPSACKPNKCRPPEN
ncbi:MAG: hypothetical protein HY010_10540 [Acidobacteria bacterium]|nr:hypothetical protein [Acidobacteriota bacterium]